MGRIPNAGTDALTDFVLESVQRGAEVHTDAWAGYNHLGRRHRLRHVGTNLAEWDDPAHDVMRGPSRGQPAQTLAALGSHTPGGSDRVGQVSSRRGWPEPVARTPWGDGPVGL